MCFPRRRLLLVWETDYFEANWQDSFWGDNYARLKRIKQKYDPDGLFFLHHGVGSEDWSADGFTRVQTSEKRQRAGAAQPGIKGVAPT